MICTLLMLLVPRNVWSSKPLTKPWRWLEAAADNGSEEARQILRERF